MNTEFALQLSTAIKEPKKFSVDGDAYNLLGIDHLTPEGEAEVMALFSRYGILTGELEVEANVQKGSRKAMEMKATRLTILTKLTTMPHEVASRLPLSQQVQLLEAIQNEVTEEESGIEEPPAAPAYPTEGARIQAEAAEAERLASTES